MVLFGSLFLLGAIGCLYVGLDLAPARRVSRHRVADVGGVPQASGLNRAATLLESAVDTAMRRRGWRPFTTEELDLAGLRLPVSSLVVLVGCTTVVNFAFGFALLGSVFFGVLLALVTPLGAKAWLRWRANRARRRFADQLPQALQLMASSLRAGHGLGRALDAVSQETEAPLGTELARVVNESRLGRDLVDSLEDVAARMGSQDFTWVAGAIASQRDTGGNLNEVLDQVAATIRDRQHVRQQVHSLSAEGRLSAVILMGLPVAIGGYYTLVAGDQMTLFVGTTIGKVLLIASGLMYLLGGLWMRSVVRIDF